MSGSASKIRGAAASNALAPPVRQFGVWLGDVSPPTAGEARLAIGAGYWRMSSASLLDVPIVDLSHGVSERLQLAATIPFYHITAAGMTARGVDDV